MKRLLISVLAAALILSGTALGARRVGSVCAELGDAVAAVRTSAGLLREDHYERLQALWERRSGLLYAWFPHGEVDALAETIARMGLRLEYRDDSGLADACEKALGRIERLSDAEKISFGNVF